MIWGRKEISDDLTKRRGDGTRAGCNISHSRVLMHFMPIDPCSWVILNASVFVLDGSVQQRDALIDL